MRTICLVWLSCALPLIALSQFTPDKVFDDHAHAAYKALLQTSRTGVIIPDEMPRLYLAAAANPDIFFAGHSRKDFTVIRQLTPRHAIIQLNTPFVSSGHLFEYLLPANNAWKISPALLSIKDQASGKQLILTVTDISFFKAAYTQHLQVVAEYPWLNTMVVRLKDKAALDTIMNSGQLLFADLADRIAKEELLVSGFDLGANRINTVHHYFPGLHGQGMMASVKENRFDSNDIDLKGRTVSSSFASPTISAHATIMATMLAGAGNSYYEGKGAAWRASLQSASFSNLMPEPESYYRTQNISVQNHSYGTGIENFYGADAAAYDALVQNNPTLMHVFSAGNSGLSASSGPYTGITGLANLTGSFKMAKNILVVGATDSVGNIELPSSRGPSYDGRIKPDVVAFGQDGSSGAAAIVSGITLLLQQGYRELHQDSLPAAALVKAVLINSAEDVGAAGPDYASGYGSVNAYKATSSLRQNRFFTNSIQQGNTQTFNLAIPPGLRRLKLTLAWTDVPAQANAAKALVNDLDIELTHTASGQKWLPWTLSRFPHKDSLLLPAVRGKDTLNNVEQVTLDLPTAGDYVISIRGSRVTGTQTYFIAYGADTVGTFQWMYPMRNDPMLAGTSVLLRWQSGFDAGTTGLLQYSLNGIAWQTIAGNINMAANAVRWNTPDTFSTALLRMTVGSNTYTTDTFVLSKRIDTRVGFNCPDSLMFYWNAARGVNSYRIYKRGTSFMEPVGVTSDTFFLTAKSDINSRHFTIAPLVNNREGIKAYMFDYTTQGVECYVRGFLAQLLVDRVSLLAFIGTLYQVNKVYLQKLSGNTFLNIDSFPQPATLAYGFVDTQLKQGLNTYRFALQLKDGRMVYSHTEAVYYTGSNPYIIFPNPAPVSGSFRILQPEPANIHVILYDAAGRKVMDVTRDGILTPISVAGLQKGLYIVVIRSEGTPEFRTKLVIN